jgi:MFS family permease
MDSLINPNKVSNPSFKLPSEGQEQKGGKAFSSLRNRNFRLLWIGGIISHTGDDMQQVAVSWLVLILTHSPFLMGVTNLLQGLPRLLFSLLGGVIVDRTNRHRLLIIFQGIEMFLAFFFAYLVLSGKIQFWHILMLVPIFGFLRSIYQLCRQAYVFDLVGRDELMNALALHSSGMNLSKIIGPSLAGILIGIWGVGWCLLINGLSFIAILISFFMMHPPAYFKRGLYSSSILQDLGEAFVYLKKNNTILLMIAASFSTIVFGLHAQVILPLFAQYILNVGASGFGFLVGATGAGAVLGGIILAGLGDLKGKGYLFLLSSLVYGFLLILFSFSSWFFVSLFILFLVGIVEMVARTINQTLVQLLSPDELRGRILGVYMLDRGMKPLGGFLMGAGASLLGAPLTLSLGAGICMFVALGLLFRSSRIRAL